MMVKQMKCPGFDSTVSEICNSGVKLWNFAFLEGPFKMNVKARKLKFMIMK
jgi:hypothetical protein